MPLDAHLGKGSEFASTAARTGVFTRRERSKSPKDGLPATVTPIP